MAHRFFEGVQVGEKCVAVSRQLQLSANEGPTAREAPSLRLNYF